MPQNFLQKLTASAAIGTGVGMFSAAMLIFLMAAALTVGDIPATLISPVTVFFLAFGSFCGGFGRRLTVGLGAALAGQGRILFVFCHIGYKISFFGWARRNQRKPPEKSPPAVWRCAMYGCHLSKSGLFDGQARIKVKLLQDNITYLQEKCKYFLRQPLRRRGKSPAILCLLKLF